MYSQFLHGTADLRGTVIIDLAAALRRQPEMGSPVGIERTEQPLLLNHCTQAGCLEGLLDPRVAQPDLMFLAQLFMKVPHVQIEVPDPIQAQNLFGLLLRYAPAAWLTPSPVQ